MEKSYKYLFFTLLLFALVLIPNNVFAEEVEQSKTINSSIGKFTTYDDALSLPTDVTNTNMTVGGGNYYYLMNQTNTRTSFFRRYFINMTTTLVSGTSYHVRIVFFREFGIEYSPTLLNTGYNNRCLNNKITIQHGANGTTPQAVSTSITRQSSTSTDPFNRSFDRFDIYFTSTQNTTNLSISIGELTSCSYMYFSNTPASAVQENSRIGINGVYVFGNAVSSGTNEQDMISQQQQTNTFLGQINQKITDLTIMLHNLLQAVIDKIQEFIDSFVQHITNFKNMVQQKFNDLIDFLTDTSLDSDMIDDFFDSITPYENSSVAYPITKTLDFLGNATTVCRPVTLTVWSTSFQLPCGTTLFWNRVPADFRLVWGVILGGLIVYKLSVKLFKIVQNAVNPKKDDLGGV